MVFGHADTPNLVNRTGFHQDTVFGFEQEVLQRSILRKLGQVALDHGIETTCVPEAIIEVSNLSTELLGKRWALRRDDLIQGFLIIEQPCFLRHHVVLGSQISDFTQGEGRLEPLAKASLSDGAILFWLMAPEMEVLEPLPLLGLLNQLADVVGSVHG
jgi:hypothetical protein